MKYLIALTGIIGSGKTTVADSLKKSIDAIILRTDDIRDYEQPRDTYQKGNMDELRQRTYEEMFKIARQKLFEGNSVILDATFQKREWRDGARSIAQEINIPFYLIQVLCSNTEVHKKRVDERNKVPWSVASKQMMLYKIHDDEKIYTIDTAPEKDFDIQIEKIINTINENRLYR